MNWVIADDQTDAIITAKKSIESSQRKFDKLPRSCVVFFCGHALDHLQKNYNTNVITPKLPRFLGSTPCFTVEGHDDICFLDGGRGAPQAVDTVETVCAMGVKRIIAIGMCGIFSKNINVGDIIIPNKAYVEEGTSHHYYSSIDFSCPSNDLKCKLLDVLKFKNNVFFELPIVSTDAVYRQTFAKERLWRDKGCVGVDMELSAVFSVSHYLNIDAAAIMLASDCHPLFEGDCDWAWALSKNERFDFLSQCIDSILMSNLDR